MQKNNRYGKEVEKVWGNTIQYEEWKEKTKNQNNKDMEKTGQQMMNLFSEIGRLKKLSVEDNAVQEKIKSLQEYITSNYYICTNEILEQLGKMYISDQRFKKNIDKAGGEGTAEFVNKAILVYCSK